jgi:hypothetical protein
MNLNNLFLELCILLEVLQLPCTFKFSIYVHLIFYIDLSTFKIIIDIQQMLLSKPNIMKTIHSLDDNLCRKVDNITKEYRWFRK